jgi:hypothetical protein
LEKLSARRKRCVGLELEDVAGSLTDPPRPGYPHPRKCAGLLAEPLWQRYGSA